MSPNILNIKVRTRPWLSGQITGKQIRIPAIRGIISIIITTKYFLFIASPTVWVGVDHMRRSRGNWNSGKHWYRQIEFPEVVPLNKFSTYTSTEFVLCSFFCEGILWLWKLQPSNELHLQDNTMFLLWNLAFSKHNFLEQYHELLMYFAVGTVLIYPLTCWISPSSNIKRWR